MGRAGRQRAIDDFDWDAIARRTVDVYRAAGEAMRA
jgi:glycosyltransferase involved in cell wall biosynthesis